MRARLAAALMLGLPLLLTAVPHASAQEPLPPPAQPQQAPVPAPTGGGDRVARLEAEIGELQAMVAALQSLVQQSPEARLPQEQENAGALQPQASGQVDPGLTARVDALETQIGALGSQIEMMTQQLGALQSRLNSGGGVPDPNAPQPLAPSQGNEPLQPLPGEYPDRQGAAPVPQSEPRYASAGEGQRFESSIFATPQTLPPAGMPDDAPVPLSAQQYRTGERVAALPPGGDAVSLFNQGYGDLLRHDYASAEISFQQILSRHPTDPLAGKAQYWLGETYYARGQFKDAAEAFLKSYKQYQGGEKAPDSLLKLGMALGELGQKDAACSALSEFGARFPAADAQLQGQATSERRKLRC